MLLQPPDFNVPLPFPNIQPYHVISLPYLIIGLSVLTITFILSMRVKFGFVYSSMYSVGIYMLYHGIYEGIIWYLEFMIHGGIVDTFLFFGPAILIGSGLVFFVKQKKKIRIHVNKQWIAIVAFTFLIWIIAPFPHPNAVIFNSLVRNGNLFPIARGIDGVWYFGQYPTSVATAIAVLCTVRNSNATVKLKSTSLELTPTGKPRLKLVTAL